MTFSPTSSAYLAALAYVLANGKPVGPRGKRTIEVEDYRFTVDNPDTSPIVTMDQERNVTIVDYTRKEMALYLSGTNRAEDFAKASSFWKGIANPDDTINSAYGYLIWHQKSCGNPEVLNQVEFGELNTHDCDWMTPWEWAKGSLVRDKDTRQAFVRFSLPRHQWFGNKDQVCTMHGLFLIRDDRLNFSIVMRSNDLVKGLVYDLPFFALLMHQMCLELSVYPKNLGKEGAYPKLRVGQYRHMAHSMHIYEVDIPKVRLMLGYPL
jgi:thymidylate synthase